jgi:hypothetical protein
MEEEVVDACSTHSIDKYIQHASENLKGRPKCRRDNIKMDFK